METYTVYLLINSSVQEVYFGLTENLNATGCTLPEEIRHWDLCKHYISNPVMIEEDLTMEAALLLIEELQEKTLRNPQGKTLILHKKTGKGLSAETTL